MKLINQLWAFFASVQLAIFTLCTLSITSIVGTIVRQGESHAFYVDKYGPKTAMFFHILDIPDMYSSWWFYCLLGTLSINLIICSLERIPAVWKIITTDNLALSLERIAKMSSFKQWSISAEKCKNTDWAACLAATGWKCSTKKLGDDFLLFCQKGRWSRTGVYMVHLSILVIFVGAIIGHFFGFKGNVMIPELRSTEKIFTSPESQTIDLGFTVRCNSFGIDFYKNGSPKEYKSNLTILENGREILNEDIRVNSPLTYKGITFYQSSYQAHQEFVVHLTDTATNQSRQFAAPFQQQLSWDEKNVKFGIINAEAAGQRALRAKIWFKAGDSPAMTDWLANGENLTLSSGEYKYSVNVKQLYSTGLQVSKDPGVWVVYTGCGLLMLGLYMTFFLSHKRVWLYQQVTSAGVKIILAGSSNKNKPAFEKQFVKTADHIEQTIHRHDISRSVY